MMDPTPNKDASASRLRILVAEDDVDSCKLYQLMLATLGHEVIGTVHDGEALLAMASEQQPDLIIADVSMPTLDGISATSNVWKRTPVPIVLISGQYSDHLRERAQLAHVMVYLQKPVTLQALGDGLRAAQLHFAQYEEVRALSRNAKTAEDDWRNVYQAKQILMKNTTMDEQHAFSRLQELAAKTNEQLAKVASRVVAAHHLTESQHQSRATTEGK